MPISRVSINQCDISVYQNKTEGVPVLYLHANSACKETFSRQYESELAKKYRFVAMDFAGHGASGKAKDASATYSVPGHAEVVIEVMKKLGIEKPVVVGSSLGGHVGLELLRKGVKLSGLLITGTPPIKFDEAGFRAGFQFKPELSALFDKPKFTRDQAAKFMKAGGFDTERYPFIVDAAEKVDELARPKLCESNMKGSGGDEKELVETNDTPLCVVQGKKDDNINNDYIQSIKYKNLFNKKIYILEEAGHSVFWDQPEKFNKILEEFLESVNR
jgi:pimeloyl-ACP methyl ester carboxylesterase